MGGLDDRRRLADEVLGFALALTAERVPAS
jgi:hypothetical protein